MLFHTTMTHTEDNCPAYNPELLPELITAVGKLDEVATELGVKVHFLVSAGGHVTFGLLEADDVMAIQRFIFSLPIRQDFDVLPVQHLQDTVPLGEALLEEAQPEK